MRRVVGDKVQTTRCGGQSAGGAQAGRQRGWRPLAAIVVFSPVSHRQAFLFWPGDLSGSPERRAHQPSIMYWGRELKFRKRAERFFSEVSEVIDGERNILVIFCAVFGVCTRFWRAEMQKMAP